MQLENMKISDKSTSPRPANGWRGNSFVDCAATRFIFFSAKHAIPSLLPTDDPTRPIPILSALKNCLHLRLFCVAQIPSSAS